MADTQKDDAAAAPRKKGKLGLLIGAAGLLVGVAGGFYATYSGLIGGSGDAEVAEGHADADAPHGKTYVAGESEVTFIPVSPLVVSLTGSQSPKHLRFTSQLEVPSEHSGEVSRLLPRVIDVMNGYLRAVDPRALESPGALITLRSQMLRRVELVVGPGRVSDVLVMEFVLS
jgi:flagellar protein FliL